MTRNGRRLWLAILATLLASVPVSSAHAGHRFDELVSTGPTDGHGSSTPRLVGMSRDGARVFFTTDARLVSDDTDAALDLYERGAGTTRLVSMGPAGGNGGQEVCDDSQCDRFSVAICSGLPCLPFLFSDDGSKAFFLTKESLVTADTDAEADLYRRSDGVTTLLSIGAAGGNGQFGVVLEGATADGEHVFFLTREQLVEADTDTDSDLYAWSRGAMRLIGPGSFEHSSPDGGRVTFATGVSLVLQDRDGSGVDLYQLSPTGLELISTGPAANDPDQLPAGVGFQGASRDGTRVFFSTHEFLTYDDGDGAADVYERSGGVTTRISTGPNGGNGPYDAVFVGSSDDGRRVFLSTGEPLLGEDSDNCGRGRGCADVYERTDGVLRLASTGPAGGNGPFHVRADRVTPDGAHLFFTTEESLVAEDPSVLSCRDRHVDNADPRPCRDIYRRSGATTTLESPGSGPFDAHFEDVSDDGGRVFFTTEEPLLPEDRDPTDGCTRVQLLVEREEFIEVQSNCADVYERFAATTSLISTGPTGGDDTFHAESARASGDGRRVLYETAEPLVPEDTDGSCPFDPIFSRPAPCLDIYAARLNSPPRCTSATADPPLLSRHHHADFRLIMLDGVTDPDGDEVTIAIDAVSQDEPLTGPADKTSPDARRVAASGQVELRGERSPRGDGRVYRIDFSASDGNGGSCSDTVEVTVPRKRKRGALDSAPPSYDSLGAAARRAR